MFLRGWIVPVGGSTPDRLKLDRLKVGGQTPTGRIHTRYMSARNSESGKMCPKWLFWLVFVFCPSFLCWRGGGSFRSGVQPPTGSSWTGSRSKGQPPTGLVGFLGVGAPRADGAFLA